MLEGFAAGLIVGYLIACFVIQRTVLNPLDEMFSEMERRIHARTVGKGS